MARLVTDVFLPDMDADEAYAQLVGDDLPVFQAATRLMQSEECYRSLPVIVDELLPPVHLALRFDPTPANNRFLFPRQVVVSQESKLGRALHEHIATVQHWMKLQYMLEAFFPVLPAPVLAFFMPWLRDFAVELDKKLNNDAAERYSRYHVLGDDKEKLGARWTHIFRNYYLLRNDTMYAQAEMDLQALLNPRPPNHYPRLPAHINSICRNGEMIVAQARMLQSSGHKLATRPLQASSDSYIADGATKAAVAEVIEEWRTRDEP